MSTTTYRRFFSTLRHLLHREARALLELALFASPFSLGLLIVVLGTGSLPPAMPAWLFALYELPLVVAVVFASTVAGGAMRRALHTHRGA